MPLAFASRPRPRLESLDARDVPSATDLGAAADFNAFVFDDMRVFNSDIEGRVAVGDHATIDNYGLGTGLPNSDGTRDDLIAGGDLDFTNGQVYAGNIVYGGAGNLESVGIPNGDERQESDVVDFATIRQDLVDKSALWGAATPNGTTRFRRGSLLLRGTSPETDVFTITADQLAHTRSLTIAAPPGATVLLNVTGADVRGQNFGLHLRGPDAGHILWNFPQAQTLSLSGVGLKGAFLAPAAAFDFNNGEIHGTVIAGLFSGNGQLHIAESEINVVLPKYATLSGEVFVDDPVNGVKDPTDEGFEGADVHLTGTDLLGNRIDLWSLSGANGVFFWGNLNPGNYSVSVIPPQRFETNPQDGIPGTVDGVKKGTAGVNKVTSISLTAGDDGIDYDLPLAPDPN